MTHVATLISRADAPAVDDAAIAAAQAVLPFATAAEWLDAGIAADIPFAPGESAHARALSELVRAKLAPRPIDVVVQPVAGRRKKLLVADMDSTMIGQECIDELADKVGLKGHVAAVTERAMRGEIAFAPALRDRVALLKGLEASVVDDVISERIRVTPGAVTLVTTMRAHGAYTCLVSGGFTLFTQRIAAMIGFDENRGNRLLIDADGRLLGRVAEPILAQNAKRETLAELTERLRLSSSDTLAIGDGANDLAMIEAAGLGIAFHAKPKVAAAAAARIDHGDLTAVLYAQGYRRAEFVGK
jgi:phosphoserine phosphatase